MIYVFLIKNILKIVINATNNFTKILSVIFKNKNAILYSENENDTIPNDILTNFLLNNNGKGIIGIYVHSIKNKIITRRINKKFSKKLRNYRVLFVVKMIYIMI